MRARLTIRHGLLTAQIAANALVGYLFWKVLAVRFGVSADKDIFDIAYAIPFVILNVGGFAFAHSVMIAHFSKVSATKPQKMGPVFATTATCVVMGSVVLAALCAPFAGAISRTVAPGYSTELQAELQRLKYYCYCRLFSRLVCALCLAQPAWLMRRQFQMN
jgi:peptidoglycan biosynthesis protein MviN/MurJ (putative lipid II flippase)